MDRRVIVTGIVAVAVAPAALAQQAQPANPQSTMQGNQPLQGGQAAMGQAEMAHI